MPLPQVVAVLPSSPADLAGVAPGDEIEEMNGRAPRDVIEYHLAADEPVVDLVLLRDGRRRALRVEKGAGEPLGVEVSSAVFDRVRTCDNHCEFCFIYQLPKGMRRSLYLKDDDYRLSFLYGNFTTLTRFTEADLERVVTERLSPLFVSIHATDPDLRARMLRNPRGAVSLRWLRLLLDHGIEVHGQVVVCPGVNDGAVLHDTFAGVLDGYPELASVAAVPLGVSRFTDEARMRPHTVAEAEAVVEAVDEWQEVFHRALGRRTVHAADEYYLMAERSFPAYERYEGFAQHENGVGMARAFEASFLEPSAGGEPGGVRRGFFAAVDGAPAEGYRAPRAGGLAAGQVGAAGDGPVTVVTGEYGARVIEPLLERAGLGTVRVLPVRNDFFGGNTAVTGLLTGTDLARVLAGEPAGGRYLLPDVCLSHGRFLDGTRPSDLPRPLEIVQTDGRSLRRALEAAEVAGGRAGAPAGQRVRLRRRKAAPPTPGAVAVAAVPVPASGR